MTCDRCGARMAIGDFPFCPHGAMSLRVVGDDVPGGFWAENGFETPRKFYSKSEHVRALAAEGLEIRAKWAGPHDQHLTRWDAVDLEAATALVSRPSRRYVAEVPDEARDPITITHAPTDAVFHVKPTP